MTAGLTRIAMLGVVLAGLLAAPAVTQAYDGDRGLSAGRQHVCALTAEASISCWGSNGLGESSNASAAAGAWVSPSAGSNATCAISTTQSITCWGSFADMTVLRADAALGTFTMFSAGAVHMCGVHTEGTLECWGPDMTSAWIADPTAAAGPFKLVSAGRNATCALSTSNAISCWGTIPAPPAGQFTSLSTGNQAACALDASSSISCWGGWAAADAADGTFRSVSTSNEGVCAITTANKIQCWGGTALAANAPSGNYGSVSVGDGFGCAINFAGRVRCWGTNDKNQVTLANASTETFPVPGPGDTTDPGATLTTPAENASFNQGQVVLADFDCTDEEDGSGLKTCVGDVADGAGLDTTTGGAKTFTVTATDAAGNSTVLTHHYTVVPDTTAPSITVSAPVENAVYPQSSVVASSFSCADDAGGTGLAAATVANPFLGCFAASPNGPQPTGGAIDTSVLGPAQFTVTANDVAGNTRSLTRHYTVVAVAGNTDPPVTPSDPVTVPQVGGAAPGAGVAPVDNPPVPSPPVLVRRTPKLSLKVAVARDATKPFAYRASGAVSLPSGIVKSPISCSGTVSLSLKRGRITVGATTVKLRRDCTFAKAVAVRRGARLSKVAGRLHGSLKLNARFGGNTVLNARTASSRTVRYGRA